MFLAAYVCGWIGFGLTIREIRAGRALPVSFLLVVALAARASLMPSNLIQENDVYRYVLDGQNLSHGLNPYRFSPTESRHQVGHPLESEFQKVPARTVLDRIGYPEIPTIYPPLAQICFAAGVGLTGWDWRGQRIVFTFLDLLVMALSLGVLRALHLPREWVALYAWNPLVLKEVANSAHFDVILSLMFVLLLLLVLRLRGVAGAALAVGFMLGCLILGKLYPVIFLPAVCIWFYRREKSVAGCLLLIAVAGGTAGAGYLPFLGGSALESMQRGLGAYARHWAMNQGFFSLLQLLTSNPRVWAYLLILGVSVWGSCRVATDTRGLVILLQGIMLAWVLVIPALFPWYALPLISLSVFSPNSVAGRLAPFLSLLLAVYYLNFYFSYHQMGSTPWTVTRTVEHALLWTWLLVLWWGSGRAGGSSIRC